jgi:hypothetical protein
MIGCGEASTSRWRHCGRMIEKPRRKAEAPGRKAEAAAGPPSPLFTTSTKTLSTATTLKTLPAAEVYRLNAIWTLNTGP